MLLAGHLLIDVPLHLQYLLLQYLLLQYLLLIVLELLILIDVPLHIQYLLLIVPALLVTPTVSMQSMTAVQCSQ